MYFVSNLVQSVLITYFRQAINIMDVEILKNGIRLKNLRYANGTIVFDSAFSEDNKNVLETFQL